MSPITTHVLDTSRGRPAVGLQVALHIRSGHDWKELGKGLTDANGRCTTLMAENGQIEPGTYRLLFNVGRLLPRAAYGNVLFGNSSRF